MYVCNNYVYLRLTDFTQCTLYLLLQIAELRGCGGWQVVPGQPPHAGLEAVALTPQPCDFAQQLLCARITEINQNAIMQLTPSVCTNV